MAHRKKAKKQVRGRSADRRNERFQRVAAPRTRLKPVIKILGDIAIATDQALIATPGVQNPLVRFDAQILARANNSLKAIRVLLEHAHWEHAVSITRQIFELLVNMEYIDQQPDRAAAIFRYCNFGTLQAAQKARKQMLYDQRTGREVDPQGLAQLDAFIDGFAAEFSTKTKAGTTRWMSSWCGKNIKELAELSTQSIRRDQYELLFSAWSEQVHAAPGSFVENMFRGAEDGWVEELIIAEDRRIVETVVMTVVLFIQLWRALPRCPVLSAETAYSWLEPLAPLMQAQDQAPNSPPNPRESAAASS